MIGFLNVYKPEGMTSNAVVQKVRKKFNIKKVGHLGTLDPMACGVLPIAIGKATRLFDYSLEKTKKYITIFDFGYTTDTLDVTGKITSDNGNIPTTNDITQILSQLVGTFNQVPPNFSAKNINGRRAYDLARVGEEFTLPPKEVTIFEIKFIEQVDFNKFKFEIVCSAGTYIRSIARDIADLLNTYACMSYLERVETGVFNLGNSIKLDYLLEKNNLNDYIISPLQVFRNFEIINIDNEIYTKLKNGIKVDYREIRNNTFVLYNNNIIGVAKPNKDILKLDTFLEE